MTMAYYLGGNVKFGDDTIWVAPVIDTWDDFEIKFIRLPCSSMVKDVVLLRAFEAGADAVVVLVCPEGQCKYVEGNIRAKKRVQWVKNLMDEIGLDGRRLALSNISAGDKKATSLIIQKTLKDLSTLGPNPTV